MNNRKMITTARVLRSRGFSREQIAQRLGIRRRELNRIMQGKWAAA